jgi:hypothetical protein
MVPANAARLRAATRYAAGLRFNGVVRAIA